LANDVGGGYQSVTQLIFRVNEIVKTQDRAIIIIEEPEIHLHPELCKRIYSWLKSQSEHNQIFVITHSPNFLDKTKISDIFYVWDSIDGDGTKIKRLTDDENFRSLLMEIGVKPSDFLFADAILLVEGKTEERVLPILAEKYGTDITSVALIKKTDGSPQNKYHIKMWKEICKNSNLPIFTYFDKHAQEIIEQAISNGDLSTERSFYGDHHCIEDIYPSKLLVDAIKGIYNIDIDPKLLKGDNNAAVISSFFEKCPSFGKEKRDIWKVETGVFVAQKMKEDQIPREMKQLFNTLHKFITTE
jgi:hypothetical protein